MVSVSQNESAVKFRVCLAVFNRHSKLLTIVIVEIDIRAYLLSKLTFITSSVDAVFLSGRGSVPC